MRTIRSLVIVSTLVGSLAAMPAALAAGQAPAGNGLFPLTGQDDITITNFVCDDATVTEVHTPRGGLASWVLGEPDRMYVLTSVSGESTVTTPDGSATYPFTQQYGRKAGKASTLACSMDFEVAYGDVTEAGSLDVTAVRIW